jgi:hypothetical protein
MLKIDSVNLVATRTSARWSGRPGNFDPLNLRAVYPGDELGIPVLPALLELPGNLVNYTARNRLNNPQDGDCVHFFVDDYRFEVSWTQPERMLTRVMRTGMALTPDFSLYPEMPRIVQMWNIYRSRWCGAWMSDHGIKVIPTMTWSDESSFDYAFNGVAPGGTVAVSTVGIIRASAQEQDRFMAGYQAMLNIVNPARVIIYGKRFPKMDLVDQVNTVEQLHYDHRRWS